MTFKSSSLISMALVSKVAKENLENLAINFSALSDRTLKDIPITVLMPALIGG